jgi:hypothetical protein
MSNAKSATGVLIQRGNADGPPETFTTIGEIRSVTPPGWSRNKIETTTHNEGTESNVLGILRQRDAGFRINYVADDPTHEQILEDILNNARATWRIALPSGVTYTGPGYIQRFELVDMPTDAAQEAECNITWAGPVVMSVPSS